MSRREDTRRLVVVAVLAALATGLTIAIMAASASEGARASTPGVEKVEVRLQDPLPLGPSLTFTDLQPGWQTVYSATMEDGFPGEWTATVGSTSTVSYTWGIVTVTNGASGGSHSAWAGGSALTGTLPLSPTGTYTDGMNAWMVSRPFDLSQAWDARLRFTASYSTELDHDYFYWLASSDGENFQGQQTSGGAGVWTGHTLTMTAYAGQPAVQIAFGFESDDNGVVGQGPFVDDIALDLLGPRLIYQPLFMKNYINGWIDLFEDPSSGWPERKGRITDKPGWNTYWRIGYKPLDGHYRIRVDEGPAPSVWFWQPDALAPCTLSTGQYCVGTSIWFIEPGWWGNAALIFGANDSNTEIYAACLAATRRNGKKHLDWFVTHNGDYDFPDEVLCNVGGKVGEGSSGTDYDGWNPMSACVDGDRVTLRVGGRYAGQWTMPGLSSTTKVGLAAGDYEVSPIEARFDYFWVTPEGACVP